MDKAVIVLPKILLTKFMTHHRILKCSTNNVIFPPIYQHDKHLLISPGRLQFWIHQNTISYRLRKCNTNLSNEHVINLSEEIQIQLFTKERIRLLRFIFSYIVCNSIFRDSAWVKWSLEIASSLSSTYLEYSLLADLSEVRICSVIVCTVWAVFPTAFIYCMYVSLT